MRHLLLLICLVFAGCVLPVRKAELDEMVARRERSERTGVCEIHHVGLERRLAKVVFGMPYTDDKHFAIFARHFPYTDEEWNGGCVVDPKIAREKHYVYICPECKRLQREWALNHRDDTYAKTILRGLDPGHPIVWLQ